MGDWGGKWEQISVVRSLSLRIPESRVLDSDAPVLDKFPLLLKIASAGTENKRITNKKCQVISGCDKVSPLIG